MIRILPESTEKYLGFQVSGEVTAEDYDVLLPRIDEVIAEFGKINLLVVMNDLRGFSGYEAAKADYHFGKNQYRQVEKTAFVGNKNWERRMVKIMDPFTRRTEERFYEYDQLDDAWQWIKQNK